MSATNSVHDYEQIILAEISAIQDQATLHNIYDLLEHAKKEEKKAENRDLRPRPDGSENAAYYRSVIDFNLIPSTTLKDAINNLLDYLTSLENLLADAN